MYRSLGEVDADKPTENSSQQQHLEDDNRSTMNAASPVGSDHDVIEEEGAADRPATSETISDEKNPAAGTTELSTRKNPPGGGEEGHSRRQSNSCSDCCRSSCSYMWQLLRPSASNAARWPDADERADTNIEGTSYAHTFVRCQIFEATIVQWTLLA